MSSKDEINILKTEFGEKEEGELEDDEDSKDDGLYCICRTSDTSRFMIGCDNCNEWYHGDCISITEEYAKKIKKFYCLICREKDPSLEIQYKERRTKKKEQVLETELLPEKYFGTNSRPKLLETDQVKYDPDYEPVRSKKFAKYAESEDDDELFEDNEYGSKSHSHPKGKGQLSKRQRPTPKTEKRQYRRYVATKPRHRKKDEITKKSRRREKEVLEIEESPKQCYGPGCVNEGRKGSKYCSDECGIKLATNRIYEILPHRIRQWQASPCEADERNHKTLESIRHEQQEARRILADLDVKQQELQNLIDKGKTIPPLTEEESNEAENEAENELSVYCVTCGHEVAQRFALKHMERCFNKYEGQTSFGSIFKTKIEGQTVFCDFYNTQQRTYCKRLRVLCPEHTKDPKIAEDEVCGCPLVTNVFESTGKFCRVLKKKCSKHFCWEKLRRAELDTERLQQWLKLDELFEKEQKIRYTMASRHGILGLMLHQTIVHDEREFNGCQQPA